MRPLVSIITINYNGLEWTKKLLQSIDNQSFKNIEIIVIDNGSKYDPSPKVTKDSNGESLWTVFFKENYPNIRFIRSEKNLGFAGGNNLAINETKGDFLFFINNDAEITEGCIPALINLFNKNPKLGIVSPLILCQNDKDKIQYAGMTRISPLTGRNKIIGENERNNNQYKEAKPTAYAHGAAMMIKREVLDNVGLMNEKYFLYYEELDWCERIHKAGYDIYIEPNAKVYHRESASIGQASPLKIYYMNRNRILFMRYHRKGIGLMFFYIYFAFIAIPKQIFGFILSVRTLHWSPS